MSIKPFIPNEKKNKNYRNTIMIQLKRLMIKIDKSR